MGNNQPRSAAGSVATSNETRQVKKPEPEVNYDHPKPGKKPLFITCRAHQPLSRNDIAIGVGALVHVSSISQDRLWAHVVVMKSSPHDGSGGAREGWLPWDCLEQMPETSDLNTAVWYHGKITRNEAQGLLDSGIHGSFLIRESESIPGSWSISLRDRDTVYHYRIMRVDSLFHISPSHRFHSLTELVQHHAEHPDGLITTLKFPVSNRQGVKRGETDPFADQWELDRNQIKINSRLGGGQYGDVYKANFNQNGIPTVVAVKTLREDNQVCEDFKKEMTIMKKLRHPHLLRLIGVCSLCVPYYLVTEYMSEGCLLEFIRNVNPIRVNHLVQLRLVIQVCDAMRYLESMNFIHRDLAARNCLVTLDGNNRYLVKVADFGLSRLIETNEVYTAKKGGKFPIKWTAPEAIAYNRFSVKSDIWSFGVLFWEVCSFGMQPYPGVDIANVYEQLQAGKRLERPDKCPRDCFSVIRSCWEWDEATRPAFVQLYETLQSMLDRYHRENEPNFRPYQPQPPPNFSSHPSVRERAGIPGSPDTSRFSPRQSQKVLLSPQLGRHQAARPTSTRPLPLSTQQAHVIDRPHTAMAVNSEFNQHNHFERNVPTRKSGGLLQRLKKSFGKGKNKKAPRVKSGKEPFSRHIEISHPTEVRSSLSQSPIHSLPDFELSGKDPPPDIWLSGKQPINPEITKPVPRKPPRRSRSKSNSGSCSSPNGHAASSGVSSFLPQNFESRGICSRVDPFVTSNSSFCGSNPSSPPPPSFNPSSPPLSSFNPSSPSPPAFDPPDPERFNISNLTPSVPELTPTNSRENLCDFSSSASQSDDFASLHSAGNLKISKRPVIKPPQVPIESKGERKMNIGGFSSLHGGRNTPNSLGTTDSDPNTDISVIISLQERLCVGLSGGVRRSVVLSCGQPLCDAASSLLHSDHPYLPVTKKFKFSEKLNSLQNELRQILINQSNDGNKLARLSTELVKLLK